MSYIKRMRHCITSSACSDQKLAIEDSIFHIPYGLEPMRVTVFCSIDSETEYRRTYKFVEKTLYKRFVEKIPAICLVAEVPVEGTVMVESMMFSPKDTEVICHKNFEGYRYVTLQTPESKILFTGGIFTMGAFEDSLTVQAYEIFHTMKRMLKSEGLDSSDIVRQWNYIGQITMLDSEGQRYQEFNNARSDFYSTIDWKYGYPAATGIGMQTRGMVVDADVISSTVVSTKALNNPLQKNAHEYSEKVLEESQCLKSAPKFERARQLTDTNAELIYVSGTAAIRGEETVEEADVLAQYHCTIDNIKQLTHNYEPMQMRVYLKNKMDYNLVKPLIDKDYAQLNCEFVVADVCRDNLLIEIEAIYKQEITPVYENV